jgi:hypothetical protein
MAPCEVTSPAMCVVHERCTPALPGTARPPANRRAKPAGSIKTYLSEGLQRFRKNNPRVAYANLRANPALLDDHFSISQKSVHRSVTCLRGTLAPSCGKNPLPVSHAARFDDTTMLLVNCQCRVHRMTRCERAAERQGSMGISPSKDDATRQTLSRDYVCGATPSACVCITVLLHMGPGSIIPPHHAANPVPWARVPFFACSRSTTPHSIVGFCCSCWTPPPKPKPCAALMHCLE